MSKDEITLIILLGSVTTLVVVTLHFIYKIEMRD